MKAVEIDRCKQELKQLKGSLTSPQYVNHCNILIHVSCLSFPLSLLSLLPSLFSLLSLLLSSIKEQKSPSIASRAGRKRGVPPYPKYILTTETEEYLKKPTFDIWHWEPNEIVSLMEHMYQELGLVAEFHMNPVTLRSWLVSERESWN